MKLATCLAILLVLFAAPAAASKVYIDYDRDYDFDKIKSFAWKTTPETSMEQQNPLMHSRIVNGIEHYITLAGIMENDKNPDVYVTYHASSEKELSVNTTNWGYGYPGGWYGGGYRYGGYWGGSMGSSSTTVSTYEVGTLVVDVWDVKTNELVWRGTAAGITVVKKPEKMYKKIDKALAKIVKQGQKARENNK